MLLLHVAVRVEKGKERVNDAGFIRQIIQVRF